MGKSTNKKLAQAPAESRIERAAPCSKSSGRASRGSNQGKSERMRFYELLWGTNRGFVFIAAGLPATDITARSWPLAKHENLDANYMCMLLWERQTGDLFKSKGRPHTGKVFLWPDDLSKLDHYVQSLIDEYENVFTHKYVATTIEDAKRGNPPAVVDVIQVEDGPFDPELPYTFDVQTSDHKQQAYYRLRQPIPWPAAQLLAEGAKHRLPGSDTGGSNPAQFCRIPTTYNTKASAVRFPVTLHDDGPVYDDAELAREFIPGGVNALRIGRYTTNSVGKPVTDPENNQPVGAIGEGEEEWRLQTWRDAKEAETAAWRSAVHTKESGLLCYKGYPKAFTNPKGHARLTWCGDASGDQSRDVYVVMQGLLLHGYTDGQALALVEHFAYTYRPHYVERGSGQVWVDLCRILWKVAHKLGLNRKIRPATPPSDTQPQTRSSTPRSSRRRGRKPQDLAKKAEKLLQLFQALPHDADGWRRTIRAIHAATLNVSPRHTSTYIKYLTIAGRIKVRYEARCIAIWIEDPSDVHGEAQGGSQDDAVINFQGGSRDSTQGIEVLQSRDVLLGEHTAPVSPLCPPIVDASAAVNAGGCVLLLGMPLSSFEPNDARPRLTSVSGATDLQFAPATSAPEFQNSPTTDEGWYAVEPSASNEIDLLSPDDSAALIPSDQPETEKLPDFDSLSLSNWTALMVSGPLGAEELCDPGAVAAWEVAGSLCVVPVMVLPNAETAIVHWIWSPVLEEMRWQDVRNSMSTEWHAVQADERRASVFGYVVSITDLGWTMRAGLLTKTNRVRGPPREAAQIG